MIHVLILGAGGHAQVIADILLSLNEAGSPLQPIGFLDDNPALIGQSRLGLAILGSLNQLSEVAHDAVIIGIGHNPTRSRLYQRLQVEGEQFISACHPRAIVARDVVIGTGSVVNAGAVINPGASIGQNVIVNTSCSIDHHNVIYDHVHIAPGAHLGGDVCVEEGAFVGIGAIVMPQRRVGAWSTVGAAALVHRDVPCHTTVIGVPARQLERKCLT